MYTENNKSIKRIQKEYTYLHNKLCRRVCLEKNKKYIWKSGANRDSLERVQGKVHRVEYRGERFFNLDKSCKVLKISC